MTSVEAALVLGGQLFHHYMPKVGWGEVGTSPQQLTDSGSGCWLPACKGLACCQQRDSWGGPGL